MRADGGGLGRARERSICAGTARADAGKERAEERPHPQERRVESTEEPGSEAEAWTVPEAHGNPWRVEEPWAED